MPTVSDVYRYTLNLVYDEMLLAYVPMTQPGTGGGGGDVNVLNFPATQPVSIAATVGVSGPLTDAELRAVAVPVSGTFWQATQPVSGTVTADASVYLTRLDEASATITYVGLAVAGSATSSAVWRIKRLDSTSGLVVLYADGDTNFNNIWDDRASLSYS